MFGAAPSSVAAAATPMPGRSATSSSSSTSVGDSASGSKLARAERCMARRNRVTAWARSVASEEGSGSASTRSHFPSVPDVNPHQGKKCLQRRPFLGRCGRVEPSGVFPQRGDWLVGTPDPIKCRSPRVDPPPAIYGPGSEPRMLPPIVSRLTKSGDARASRLFGAVGLLLLASHSANLLGPLAEYTFVVIGSTTMAACLAGVRRYKPRRRSPWWLATLSIIVFVVSGGLRVVEGTFGDLSPERSLLPDYFALPAYGMVGMAMLGFLRARNGDSGRDIDALLDSAVVSLGVLTVAWAFLMSPALYADRLTIGVRFSIVVYPPVSVFISALGVHLASSNGRRVSPAQRLLLIMALGMLTGDVLLTLGDARIVAIPKVAAEIPYVLGFLAMGCAGLHPSMRDLTEVAPKSDHVPLRSRLLLTGMGLVLPVLVALSNRNARGSAFVVLIAMVVTLTLLAIGRMLRALRAQARAQARLQFEATHDALTRLPNRGLALGRLAAALNGDDNKSVTVVFVDLDRFKLVNDSGGHGLGDELLIAAAHRLVEAAPSGSTVARIGGDEFLVIMVGLLGVEAAVAAAEELRRAFQLPFLLRGGEIFSSASLGLTYRGAQLDPPADAVDAESLIRDSDTAMYRAKAAGRDGVAVFDRQMRDEVAERVALEQDLRRAVEKNELVVHFQPIVSLRDLRLEGFEALVRWQHHSRGLIGPDRFIPIAEESDLIVDIGTWVLDQSLVEVAGWRTSGVDWSGLYVAVNFSTRQLRDPAVVETVASALRRAGLPPSSLCVEMTESLLMKDPDAVAATLKSVRKLGVKLSIDDFGTGYSSLSYLHRFPVDYVKIDKSFVDALDTADGVGGKLVAAIVAMSGAMGLRTIAEGVETAKQSRRLIEMGADRGQGYFYGRPLPAASVPALLRTFERDFDDSALVSVKS